MFAEAMGRVYITSTVDQVAEDPRCGGGGRKVGAGARAKPAGKRQIPELRLAYRRSTTTPRMPRCAILKTAMRDPEIIETDLMEISAIADDLVKFERIVAWCASHPDEVPFALHQLLKQKEKGSDHS